MTKKCAAAGILARIPARRLYEVMLWASTSGLGMNNYEMDINGETRFAREWFLKNRNRRLTVFDVGSHEGWFSKIAAAHPNRDLHVFEPQPASRAKIERLGLPDVRIWPFALGSMPDAKATLWDHDPSGSCEASLFRDAVTHVGIVPVPFDVEITTLDDFCSTHAIKKIDYLKVDVEGSERAVFEGGQRMIRNGVEIIHFEINEKALLGNFSVSKAMDLLSGYKLFASCQTDSCNWVAVRPAPKFIAAKTSSQCEEADAYPACLMPIARWSACARCGAPAHLGAADGVSDGDGCPRPAAAETLSWSIALARFRLAPEPGGPQ
jgi:FkbM family methyltransferase